MFGELQSDPRGQVQSSSHVEAGPGATPSQDGHALRARRAGRDGRIQCGSGSDVRRATAENPVSIDEIRQLAAGRFGDMVKGVVDLRPSFGNRSRGVDDPATRDAIATLVHRVVRR